MRRSNVFTTPRASLSMASLIASSSSMLVRLRELPRVMAVDSALMTNRGLTPERPSSGASDFSR